LFNTKGKRNQIEPIRYTKTRRESDESKSKARPKDLSKRVFPRSARKGNPDYRAFKKKRYLLNHWGIRRNALKGVNNNGIANGWIRKLCE